MPSHFSHFFHYTRKEYEDKTLRVSTMLFFFSFDTAARSNYVYVEFLVV